MIVSTDTRSPAPGWLRAATWVAVLCALPFGLIYCDRPEAPTEPDEETAAELVVLEGPQESPDPADTGLEELLSTREEEINQDILQEVESGALSAVQGRNLSAYVAGAKAGLLISFEGRYISEAEKQALADRLSDSFNRKKLPDRIADSLMIQEFIIQAITKDQVEILLRATRSLERVNRPAPPIIRRPPGGASQIVEVK